MALIGRSAASSVRVRLATLVGSIRACGRVCSGLTCPSMNTRHQQLCTSPDWAAHLQGTVLPAVTAGVVLGAELLELGPGPGAATDWLRKRVRRLVAIEADERTANALRNRFLATNVEVVHGDATALPFACASFDSVAAFTMLHHVPTRQLQARVLTEALRVARPGGAVFGSDSLHSDESPLPPRRHLQPD